MPERDLSRSLPGVRATTAGKYLISPLVKRLDDGWFSCSVSIRSGSGQGTTDRVVRLTRLFRDQLSAADYARAEGLHWIGAGSRAARPA